jgi:hypothetical protein
MEKHTSDKETQTDVQVANKLIIDLLPNEALDSPNQKTHVLIMVGKWMQEMDRNADSNLEKQRQTLLPKKPKKH